MEKLINWSELSRLLTKGDRGCIRANKIPAKYKRKVDGLLKILEDWAKT